MIVFYTKAKYEKAEKTICKKFGYPNKLAKRYSDEWTAKLKDKDVWIMPKPKDVKIDFDIEINFENLTFPKVKDELRESSTKRT